MDDLPGAKVLKESRSGLHDSEELSLRRHPLGAGIGAVLAAGTAGATGGILAGPVGAIVGAVVGAVAGGMSGKAIADFVDPATAEDRHCDMYATRIHFHSPDSEDDVINESSSNPEITQSSRETWSYLDQSSENLISPPSNDS